MIPFEHMTLEDFFEAFPEKVCVFFCFFFLCIYLRILEYIRIVDHFAAKGMMCICDPASNFNMMNDISNNSYTFERNGTIGRYRF